MPRFRSWSLHFSQKEISSSSPIVDFALRDGERGQSVALGELPDVFRANVNLIWPHERAIPDANHAEEVVVFQLPPIWLVKVAGAVEYAALAGVEFDIDFVPVKRPCRDNVMQCIHNVTL